MNDSTMSTCAPGAVVCVLFTTLPLALRAQASDEGRARNGTHTHNKSISRTIQIVIMHREINVRTHQF